ncbi:hypothetical protein MRX96_014096 [Rhipicephalus microplus]
MNWLLSFVIHFIYNLKADSLKSDNAAVRSRYRAVGDIRTNNHCVVLGVRSQKLVIVDSSNGLLNELMCEGLNVGSGQGMDVVMHSAVSSDHGKRSHDPIERSHGGASLKESKESCQSSSAILLDASCLGATTNQPSTSEVV